MLPQFCRGPYNYVNIFCRLVALFRLCAPLRPQIYTHNPKDPRVLCATPFFNGRCPIFRQYFSKGVCIYEFENNSLFCIFVFLYELLGLK